MKFERISSETVFEGPIADVHSERFRYEDGEESERQVIRHPGSAAVVAHDDEFVHLVRQPREAVGEAALLELPAGTLDVEGESPLECARRELGEEVGVRAERWELLRELYASPGFLDEVVHLFEATDLSDVDSAREDDEQIEVVTLPLAELPDAIGEIRDAKTLVGLLILQRRLQALAP